MTDALFRLLLHDIGFQDVVFMVGAHHPFTLVLFGVISCALIADLPCPGLEIPLLGKGCVYNHIRDVVSFAIALHKPLIAQSRRSHMIIDVQHKRTDLRFMAEMQKRHGVGAARYEDYPRLVFVFVQRIQRNHLEFSISFSRIPSSRDGVQTDIP